MSHYPLIASGGEAARQENVWRGAISRLQSKGRLTQRTGVYNLPDSEILHILELTSSAYRVSYALL